MFDRGRSGQFLYFGLVSAISGNPVGGCSGNISGTRSIDGGVRSSLSGFITDVSGGQYVANLYDFDLNGNCIGFLFTASGCVPVSYTVITQQNVSGRIFAASGTNAVVPPASLSGVVANSGLFVTATATVASGSLYLASGSIFRATFASGVLAASGGLTTAWGDSGQAFSASGALAVVPVASLSGVVAASGIFANVPPATLSGVVPASGIFANVPIATLSGVVAASGIFGTASLNSGQSVLVYSGQLSGQIVSPASGVGAPLSGLTYIASGPTVVATANVASGSLYLASGSIFRATFASGVLAASGGITTAWGDSGQAFSASGANVVVPVASLSGVVAASGIFGTASLNSGQSVLIYSGQMTTNQYASGVLAVEIPRGVMRFDMSGQMSGLAARSPGNALRKLINRWSTTANSGRLTVYTEDDSTQAYTQDATSQSGAAPITALDTN